MELHRAGETPSAPGPQDWFTGTVWMDRVVKAPAPARVGAYRVTFAPGARTAWHTHPLGQTLHVLMGLGRFQSRGEPVQALRPGDTVWIAPGEEHWHGAAPDAIMVHLAIQEADAQGAEAGWLEQVAEDDYRAPPAAG